MRRTFNFLFNLGEDVKEKKLSIGFLIDLSGSMQGEPLYNLKNALLQILNPLVQNNPYIYSTDSVPAADEVMLMTFATQVQKVCPWVKQNDYDFFKELLLAVPEAIFGKSGCTAIYDGVYEILNEFTKAKKENEKILIIFSDGGEYNSKRKKSEVVNLIKKYKQGYLTSSQYNSLISKIGQQIIDSLTEKLDDDYVFKKEFNSLISSVQLNESLKNEIEDFQSNSICNIKIFSLFYKGENYQGDINLLKEFAKMTDGEVYNSPQEESIPIILNEMIMDILYEKKSSLRTKLYKRLNSNSKDPWFKLFSFNLINEDKKDCSFAEQYKNPIYYLNVKDKNIQTRQECYTLFNDVFSKQIFNDLNNCVDDNSSKLSHISGINDQLNVLIVLRGNDRLGISSAEFIARYIKENISKLINAATKVWIKIVLLLDKFKEYSEQEKQELYAFLNEINQTDNDQIHTIYFLSDYNKYAHNQNSGYILLESHQFEDFATEILFGLNFNQDLDNNIIGGTVDQEGNSSRFVAIGGTSAYLSKQEYTDVLTGIFTADFLTKLFNKEKLPLDEKFVEEKLREYLNTISYDLISNRLIECHPQLENMFQQLSCPSIKQVTPFRKEVILQIYNKRNPKESKVSITRSYFNFVDYITLLYYDVIDYIDSSHSIEFFEAELDRRLDALFKEYYGNLKSYVDDLIYRDDKMSSPLAAKEFLSKLLNYIVDELENNLTYKFQNDPIKKELDNWRFKNSEGVLVPPGNPSEDINELRKQIQNFPLPWSIRFRYGSLGALLGGMTLSVLWFFGFGIIGLIPASLLAIISIAVGEFKVRTIFKKLQNIINKYEDTHRYYTWQKAFGIYCENIKNFFELLKEKIKREEIINDDPFLINQFSESELIDLFEEATNKTIPHLVLKEEEKKSDSNKFHLSLKPYLLNNIYNHITDRNSLTRVEINSNIIYEMKTLGLDLTRLENSKQLLVDILSHNLKIQLKEFPSVFIGPIPIKYKNLSPGLQSKLDIITINKDKEYLLTLLQDLTDDEKKELLEVWKDDFWKNTVNQLIKLRKHHNEIENNLFILWREIVKYEIWLKKIKELITMSIKNEKELESKFNLDNIFYAWKNMYGARRQFKQGLFNVFNIISTQIVDASFDIWKIILGLKPTTDLYDLINGNSYPAVSVFASNLAEYPRIINYYSANESLSLMNLQNRNINLSKEFPAKTTIDEWNYYSLSVADDQVYFNKIYYMNLKAIEKYSIFASLLEFLKKKYQDDDIQNGFKKMKEDSKTLKKIFLEEFYKNKFENGNIRKKFHFIGEINNLRRGKNE